MYPKCSKSELQRTLQTQIWMPWSTEQKRSQAKLKHTFSSEEFSVLGWRIFRFKILTLHRHVKQFLGLHSRWRLPLAGCTSGKWRFSRVHSELWLWSSQLCLQPLAVETCPLSVFSLEAILYSSVLLFRQKHHTLLLSHSKLHSSLHPWPHTPQKSLKYDHC